MWTNPEFAPLAITRKILADIPWPLKSGHDTAAWGLRRNLAQMGQFGRCSGRIIEARLFGAFLYVYTLAKVGVWLAVTEALAGTTGHSCCRSTPEN